MKAAAVALLTGEGRAGCSREAGVPAREEVGDGESVGKGKVGEEGAGVIDDEGEGVGHAWKKEGRRGEGVGMEAL